MRRKAFTLTEVVISVLVLGIMAAAITFNPNSAKQTAEREAERVSAMISRLIGNADRTHGTFWIDVKDDGLEIRTGKNYLSPAKKDDFKASKGCSYSRYGAVKMHMSYNVPSGNIRTSTHKNFTMNNIRVDISEKAVDTAYNIQVESKGTNTEYYVVLYENLP